MIKDIVIFGATGDLAGRFLLPALATLLANGRLDTPTTVTGSAQEDWDDARFRGHAAARLRAHVPAVPSGVVDELLTNLRYVPVDVTDPASVGAVIGQGLGETRPVAVYLALPVQVIPAAVATLAAVDLPSGSRIVVEKPFGVDRDSARALNVLLRDVVAGAGRSVDVFHVDHVLGMETLSNLLTLRFANLALRSMWNSTYIERVEILWEESLGLEGRAGYFDRVGALKDVLQNHMMQVLSLVAMEEPVGPEQVRDRKVDLLRAILPPTATEASRRSRRARYTAGRLAGDADGGGRTVPSYVDEAGVDPERSTETFAEVRLDIDTPRWAGTRFVLRAGKAMARRRKGVLVHFRPSGGDLEGPDGGRLWVGLDGPDDVRLELARSSRDLTEPSSLTLASPPLSSALPAYGHVLLDILRGGHTLAVGGEEAEQAWRVVTPVLDTWRSGSVPLENYPAGSPGPPGT